MSHVVPDVAPKRKGARVDAYRVAMCVLIIVTVGRVHQYFGVLAVFRPGLLSEALALGYAFLVPSTLAKDRFFGHWPMRVVIALGVLACAMAPFGLSFGASAQFILENFSKELLLSALLVLSMRSVRELRLYFASYTASVGFLCFASIFLVGTVSQFGSLTARLNDDAMFMYDPNDLGVLLAIAAPVVILLLQTSRSRLAKAACLALLGAICWTVALSGSRGGFLAMLAVGAGLIFMAHNIPASKRVGSLIAVLVVLVVAAPPGYWNQIDTIVHPSDDYNLTDESGRIAIWKRGMGYMREYPLTGIGIANFSRAEGTISWNAKHHVEGTGLKMLAPHNSFVQVAAEMGVPGFVLFIALTVGGIFAMRRLHRRIPRTWARGDDDERFLYLATMYLPIAQIGFVVAAFFVSFAYLSPVYMMAAFMTGLYRAVDARIPRRPRPQGWRAATSIARQRARASLASGRFTR